MENLKNLFKKLFLVLTPLSILFFGVSGFIYILTKINIMYLMIFCGSVLLIYGGLKMFKMLTIKL